MFMRALLFIGILTNIWGIDPRGVWRILPVILLAFVKDYMFMVLVFCGLYYLDAFCRVVFESLGRTWFSRISKWITCGIPLLLTIILQLTLTGIAIKINRHAPRTYLQCFETFLIFLWTVGISYSAVFIYSLRRKAGLNLGTNQEQRKIWLRMIRLVVLLWIGVITAAILTYQSVVQNTETSLEDAQVIRDPSKYHPYTFLALYILGAILVYLHGKISRNDGKAADAPAAPKTVDMEKKGGTVTNVSQA
jgi:hypothetical protein